MFAPWRRVTLYPLVSLAGLVLLLATSQASASQVDVSKSSKSVDLKIDASGDSFSSYMGTAQSLVIAAPASDASSTSATVALSTAPAAAPAVAPALIPLPAGVWTGLLVLGAIGVGLEVVARVVRRVNVNHLHLAEIRLLPQLEHFQIIALDN